MTVWLRTVFGANLLRQMSPGAFPTMMQTKGVNFVPRVSQLVRELIAIQNQELAMMLVLQEAATGVILGLLAYQLALSPKNTDIE
jgi:hypothetical protein